MLNATKSNTAMDGPLPATMLADLLRGRSKEFFGFADRVDVQLRKENHRRHSSIYRFKVASRTHCHEILVKVPIGPTDKKYAQSIGHEGSRDRPRLFSRVEPKNKATYEYSALSRIADHLETLHDPRFGSIRMFGFLPDHDALIMEMVRQPPLRKLFLQMNRVCRPFVSIDLHQAFRNSGAWLSMYHQLPGLNQTRRRNESRSDFLDSIDKFSEYLIASAKRETFFDTLRTQIKDAARAVLPVELPLGSVHGDFAPRNILVGEAGQVTVFDTLARFQAPIYEDIAKFLITLKGSGLQMSSQGLLYSSKLLADYENGFLLGYFGEHPIPLRIIRLFEVQLLLELWAAIVYQHRESSGVRRIAKSIRRVTWTRFISQYIHHILTDLFGHSNIEAQVRSESTNDSTTGTQLVGVAANQNETREATHG